MNPQHIGPYVIERKIGAGGMGTVYLGQHGETSQQAAIKVLPPMLAREPGFLARFEREIDALRKLSHPNVVQLFESGVDGDISYYAMEYVDGITVMDRLKTEKRIPWQEVIQLGIQICGALKAAHNAGIVHRDLKPSNLLLTTSGDVKLTDFGVAQVFASNKLTVTGGVIGTAEYMSPEQAAGKRADKRSDIYALGAVMYVMLTGRPPFTGKTSFDVARQHQTGRFDSPRMIVPEIPYWLDEVICQCLEKKPEDRYPDTYVLSRRLEEIPKKVQLAAQDHTIEFDRSSPTAETLAANADREQPGGGGEAPIGATLVRDLVRAQLEEEQSHHPVARALENTWILVALLVLLILGGILWFRFVDRNSLAEDPQRALSADREVDQFLKRARVQQEIGHGAQALATLQSLLALLPETGPHATDRKLVLTRIARLQEQAPDGEYPLLRGALDDAQELLDSGDTESAREIWQAIVALYDSDDPDSLAGVAEARTQLERTAPTPDVSADPASAGTIH